jgi:hypothetical protein
MIESGFFYQDCGNHKFSIKSNLAEKNLVRFSSMWLLTVEESGATGYNTKVFFYALSYTKS